MTTLAATRSSTVTPCSPAISARFEPPRISSLSSSTVSPSASAATSPTGQRGPRQPGRSLWRCRSGRPVPLNPSPANLALSRSASWSASISSASLSSPPPCLAPWPRSSVDDSGVPRQPECSLRNEVAPPVGSGTAICKNRKGCPSIGDHVRVNVDDEQRFGRGRAHQDFAPGIDDHAVTGVRKAVAGADPVDTDDVSLVLNGPGVKQCPPMNTAPFRPVSRNDVGIGVCCGGPELVGEPKVVTDEECDANSVDVDRQKFGT
jgi:hypothetical protein